MSDARGRRIGLACLLFVLGLAGFWYFGKQIGDAGAPLVTAGGFDGLDLEFAWTGERATEIVRSWSYGPPGVSPPPLVAAARKSLHADFGFILAYVAVLTGFWWWLKETALRAMGPEEDFHGRARRFFNLALCLPAVGGGLDVVENLSLLAALGSPGPVANGTAALASLAATLKFLLTMVPAFVAAIVLIRLLLQGAFRRRGETASPTVSLGAVRAAEKAYLLGRRERAGNPATAEARGWVGLALSGGGIRSATTNLGALQALIARGTLPFVDYLSTVSGGGYIGGALSSLLSINGKRMPQSSQGGDGQYEFAAGDAPYFSVAGGRPPFVPEPDPSPGSAERFDGKTAVRHLRSHGDLVIVRKQWIHRDVLRAVGNVAGGIFFHWLLALVVSSAIVALYLLALHGMLGDLRGLDPATYWEELGLFHNLHAGPASPRLAAAATGALVFAVGLGFCSFFAWRLPRRWLERPGESVDDSREFHCLWALFFLTLLTALIYTGRVVGRQGQELSMVALPMFVYLGGLGVGLIGHALVGVWPGFGRNERSRFAAWKGIFEYLTVASIVVLTFPLAIEWILERPEVQAGGLASWLVSVAGTWALAQAAKGGGAGGPATGFAKKLISAGSAVRNAALGVLVGILVVLTWLLLAVFLVKLSREAGGEPAAFFWRWFLGSVAALVVLGLALDFNKLSLHYFYRDRLVETYLQTYCNLGESRALDLERDNGEMPLSRLHGAIEGSTPAPASRSTWKALRKALWPRREVPELGTLAPVEAVTGAPLHLLVASLNLTRARDLKRRNRKSDSFVFSKLYSGSNTTGYLDTRLYRDGETKLARAVTISGAAASSAMGHHTFFAQSFATTVFNVRLGQWMENPAFRGGRVTHRQEGWVFWPKYLLKEMLAATDASERLINLSDGGHTGDNVGLYPLFLRRCRLIIAGDAEADPARDFGSFTEALRQVRIDQGIEVDIDLSGIHPDKQTGLSVRPFAVGRISYPEVRDAADPAKVVEAASVGWLLVVKNTLTGQESELIRNYRLGHPKFPHESTADLFFDDAQFEAYRELGAGAMRSALGPELRKVLTAKGWLDDWQRDLPWLVGG